MSNEELIQQQLQEGSSKAFEEIFKAYHNELCNYIYKIILDKDDAKEIAQQVFIKLWERRESIGEIASLRSYIFRSAHNTCMNRFKHEKIKARYASEEGYLLQADFYADYENTHDPDLTDKIREAVEDLPRKNKEVFKLRYFSGLNTKQVSEELNITPRTVETHVSNALKMLRDNLGHLLQLTIILLYFR